MGRQSLNCVDCIQRYFLHASLFYLFRYFFNFENYCEWVVIGLGTVTFKQNNWKFNKAGENQGANFEEGGVVVRCSVHNADHAQWLVEQGREGKMEKEKVGALLCEEDKEGSCLLSLSDSDVQREAAMWNVEATNKISHMMSADFIQWLILQAKEREKALRNWRKEQMERTQRDLHALKEDNAQREQRLVEQLTRAAERESVPPKR